MSLFRYLLAGIVVVLTCVVLFAIISPEQYDEKSSDRAAWEDDEHVRARMAARSSGRTVEEVEAELKEKSNGRNAQKSYSTSVQIVVLGDIGRSPRMQYHAMSLVEHGAYVHIVGYLDSDPHPNLAKSGRVRISAIPAPPRILQPRSRLLFPLLAPLKVLFQTLSLAWILAYTTRPCAYCLVQNPPAIPVLLIARLVSLARNTKLVIDWHNFGWSVLALRLGARHPLVRLAETYEKRLARTADAHFCVTRAMATYLSSNMHVTALPLHDRPAPDFRPLDTSKRPEVYRKLEILRPHAAELESGDLRLLVSSTSWTPDEDFSILLSALQLYARTPSPIAILLVITGKGPQQASYLTQIASLTQQGKLNNITITTAFLPFADYAALLSVADLGICLHRSTSGLDLPMKVVDMFGAGLPVVGWDDYASWPELVKEGVNGRGFKSAEELAGLLERLLAKESELGTLREGALVDSRRRWREEWDGVAGEQVFFTTRGKMR